MRNAVIGLLIAAGVALSASDLSVFGIAAWKIVLAACGAVLFVLGGTSRRDPRRPT